MARVSIHGTVQEEDLCNALGQQVVRRMGQAGVTIHVVHDFDGNRPTEYALDKLTGAPTVLQEYIWLDGLPVAVVDGQTDAVFFVRTDHIHCPAGHCKALSREGGPRSLQPTTSRPGIGRRPT